MTKLQKCTVCGDIKRGPFEENTCETCAGTGIKPSLDALVSIKDLALGTGQDFRAEVKERFPSGTATEGELLLWLAEHEAGPMWFYSKCIGSSYIHAKFDEAIESAMRDAMRKVVETYTPTQEVDHAKTD